MPILYGYIQFNAALTKGFCWSLITLNVTLFVVLYLAQINKISALVTDSFHAQIICNFLSTTALYATVLTYVYYPSVFITHHRLFDFCTYPYIGIGVLTTFNATILLLSYITEDNDKIQASFPLMYYGCFVLFYIESCVHCIYFLYLLSLVLILYILGMQCNHRVFDPNSIPLQQQITSESHPLHVDFIKIEPFTNIGMTILPGKTKGRYNRNLEMDIKRLKHELDVSCLVCLVPNDELERCHAQQLKQIAAQNGLRVIHFPWRDKFIPKAMHTFHHFIRRLQQYHTENRKIVIHCNGGVGRTGTVTACLLMKILNDEGSQPNDINYASKLMREARRPVMFRNPLQRCFARTYYHYF